MKKPPGGMRISEELDMGIANRGDIRLLFHMYLKIFIDGHISAI